jgi:hypothetical protein
MTDSPPPHDRGSEPALVVSRRTLRRVLGATVAVLVLAGVAIGAYEAGRSTSTSTTGAVRSSTTSTTTAPSSTVPRSTTSRPATTTSSPATTTTTTSALLPTITLAADGGSEPTWTGIKPPMIGFSGDSGNIVESITWPVWTWEEALGHGTWGYDSCVPDCASGVVTNYPAIITLSDLVGHQFTTLTERTEGPHGFEQSFALPARADGAPWISLGDG